MDCRRRHIFHSLAILGFGSAVFAGRSQAASGLRFLGLGTYLVAVGRMRPDRRLLLQAERAAGAKDDLVPYWGGQASVVEERRPNKLGSAHVLDRSCSEYTAMVHALEGLERSLLMLAEQEGSSWRESAMSGLHTVTTSLEAHCQAAEAPDGLITQLESSIGRSQRVTLALKAHEHLCLEVQALSAELMSDVDLESVHGKALKLRRALRRHLALEGDLVLDLVMDPDDGIGD